MSHAPPDLSIIIPAYNEGQRLGRGLSRIREYFAGQPVGIARIEIIVVDDGSTDDTAQIAQQWARDIPSLRLVSNGKNRGKGFSVRHGILEARGRVAIFTDADLSSPIEESAKLLTAIHAGNDVAIGSRAIDRSLDQKEPLIVVSCSGGARMMEGVVSLMQLAKVSAALGRMDEAKLPFISILTDPTTGGVTASYAMLGDLNIAEPGALIGFAGPRVIEQTIRQKLPEGFQTAEFLLEHGFLDAVVPRKELKPYIAQALDFFVG